MPRDGDRVPESSRVFRLLKTPEWSGLNEVARQRLFRGEALDIFLTLSSADKLEKPPALSVWLEGMTSVRQAWILRNSDPRIDLHLLLPVDEVRAIRSSPHADSTDCPFLEVVFKPLPHESRPGHDGHCGVVNLDRGNKTQTRYLRDKLAELASGFRFRALAAGGQV